MIFLELSLGMVAVNTTYQQDEFSSHIIIFRVKSDMDEPNGKLMGAHGYCTQEMVNLLLGGRGVSNVFNDTVTLDGAPGEKSTVLQGVSKRSDVGLLSLFEHYKSCQVIVDIYEHVKGFHRHWKNK